MANDLAEYEKSMLRLRVLYEDFEQFSENYG